MVLRIRFYQYPKMRARSGEARFSSVPLLFGVKLQNKIENRFKIHLAKNFMLYTKF